jgi:hypothetical protein
LYAGSAWRGLFGHALKRTVCVTCVDRDLPDLKAALTRLRKGLGKT